MDKKEIIVASAQSLFSQFGLKKVTVEEITETARVSKATIYKYFQNKEEIFNEVVKIETGIMLESIREAVASSDTVFEKLRAHLMTKIKKIRELINFYRVTQESWGEHWPYIDSVRRLFLQKEKEIIKEILILGNSRGELDVADIDTTAHIMVVGQKSIELSWAVEECALDLDDFVDLVLNIALNGIRKR